MLSYDFVSGDETMSLMTAEKLQSILEAALMVAGHPLTIAALQNLFNEDERPSADDIKTALEGVADRHKDSGIELHEVASGYRLQARTELSPWLAKLWEERPARYSRAFLETLAIIAYKQPITRAEIEEIRGVTVSSNIMKTLSDREWIRLVGFRETPGKPALYGTTKTFLDHFGLTSLKEMPTLAEFKDMQAQEEALQVQLAIENSDIGPGDSEVIPQERDAIMAEDTPAESSEQAMIEQAEPLEADSATEIAETIEEAQTTEADESIAFTEAAEISQTEAVIETIEAAEPAADAEDMETVIESDQMDEEALDDSDLALAQG
jgi:segregation and condensation protein B